MRSGTPSVVQRLPDFLIIGAQKCGTTTLYRDLLTNPSIEFAVDKETDRLLTDKVLGSAGRSEYATMYQRVSRSQLCGDASTTYSMLPDHQKVAERARLLLGSGVRIIYLVRNPIERIVSHHYHDVRRGAASTDINREVKSEHRYVSYSKYAYQLKPWLETFGRRNILAVDFHRYVNSRSTVLREINLFLGASDFTSDTGKVYNEGRRVRTNLGPLASRLRESTLYQRARPVLPHDIRAALGRALAPPSPQKPSAPSRATIEWLISQLSDDIDLQPSILGWESVPWTTASLRRRYAVGRENPGPEELHDG